VAFTVSDGKVAVYINGEERFAGEAFPNIFEGSAASFGLAVNYWGQPFKGLIDELYIQDGIVLPADEIKALYDEGAAVGNQQKRPRYSDPASLHFRSRKTWLPHSDELLFCFLT
jgi:hypothetical protein